MPEPTHRFGLPPAALAALQAVLARQPRLARAVVFGSRAKGTFRPGSDIDIALFGEDLTQADLLALDAAIDDLDLPYRVDVVLFGTIDDAALRAHIERVGLDICGASAMSKAD